MLKLTQIDDQPVWVMYTNIAYMVTKQDFTLLFMNNQKTISVKEKPPEIIKNMGEYTDVKAA